MTESEKKDLKEYGMNEAKKLATSPASKSTMTDLKEKMGGLKIDWQAMHVQQRMIEMHGRKAYDCYVRWQFKYNNYTADFLFRHIIKNGVEETNKIIEKMDRHNILMKQIPISKYAFQKRPREIIAEKPQQEKVEEKKPRKSVRGGSRTTIPIDVLLKQAGITPKNS
jgi:hypothetical protein